MSDVQVLGDDWDDEAGDGDGTDETCPTSSAGCRASWASPAA
ncbi:hypothetical protein [Terracoccus luteus]|uniref:Uncharacterized protein n=1 Tax=Terracoccus luteus TaxID=53356 RepID=A0A839Q1L9_9MICO|nr:hypothetical protein [Terracoccus luteus]MBB2986531.1 hypothetical protein [Terracoccus luteus]MCP2171880.1 hypothetical protein [Terracoccus luteus]